MYRRAGGAGSLSSGMLPRSGSLLAASVLTDRSASQGGAIGAEPPPAHSTAQDRPTGILPPVVGRERIVLVVADWLAPARGEAPPIAGGAPAATHVRAHALRAGASA